MERKLIEYLKNNKMTEDRLIGKVSFTRDGGLLMFILENKYNQKEILNDEGNLFTIEIIDDYFVPMSYYEFNVLTYIDDQQELLTIDYHNNLPIKLNKSLIKKKHYNNLKISQLKVGKKYIVQIDGIADFGVFVKVQGVNGQIHSGLIRKTDLSYVSKPIDHEQYIMGDNLEVILLNFDEEKRRINFGIKQLNPNPWEFLSPELKEGSIISGIITSISDFGLFLEVQQGVKGLIHIREISWIYSSSAALKKQFTINQEITAKVILIDRDNQHLQLSIKQLTIDPWKSLGEKYKVNDIVKGKVIIISNYGLRIEIEKDVYGQIQMSEISYDYYEHPNDYTSLGEIVTCKIIFLDLIQRKITLSIKALEADPWKVNEEYFPIRSIHEATILKINYHGAYVKFADKMVAFVPKNHLKTEDNIVLKINDRGKFKIIGFREKKGMVLASHWYTWR